MVKRANDAPAKPLFKKILIANDSLQGMDIALDKAALIEHFSGAAIEVAEVIYDTIAEEPEAVLPRPQQAALIEGLKAAERNGLRRLIEPYESRVAELSCSVIWHKQASEGVLTALNGVDLLIKPVSQHKILLDRLQAPLDWSLMRAAPCPVLISKQPWPATPHVVAALDAADTTHAALNRSILEHADQIARILGCDLHVVSAYPSLGQTVNELQVAMDYAGIKKDMRESRAKFIESLIAEVGAGVARTHLLEGRARDVIPEMANELGAAVTVLGTAARRGLSQLIIGNTAEAIIGALNSDVITVRESG